MKLISNSFGYKVTTEEAILYYGEQKVVFAKRVTKEKYADIINSIVSDGTSLILTGNEEYFYYSFYPLDGLDKRVKVKLHQNKKIKREFVKWRLYKQLKDCFVIDFNRLGDDISIYRKNASSRWNGWDSYSGYSLLIKNDRIHLSKASGATLISQKPIEGFVYKEKPLYKAIVNNHIVHKDNIATGGYNCVASREVRIGEKLIAIPKPPNYSAYYDEIKIIYEELATLMYDDLIIMRDGFIRLEEQRDYFSVARSYNVMLFKHNRTNVNASNGMKSDGPYAPPLRELKNLEFIFIYPNSEKTKELYNALRNGKTSYFPGLERYVDIPIRQPSKEMILKYDYTAFEKLPSMVEEHIENLKRTMPDKEFFAIVLLPKSKNDDISDEHAEYFELKYVLIKQGIPSQFIDERAVGTDNFVFWLPNIAIAIQAKLGGIPWRLNREEDKELIIGFGDASKGESDYIGSTVFFDNGGRLKASNFFRNNNLDAFKQSIREAILRFIEQMAQKPERLVIHYFKIPGNKEKDAVMEALKGMGLNIPFVIVTINETKSKNFLAFDESYGYGMPMSGTAWRIYWDEFILFNNTRYEENPRSGRPPKQEFPVKLKLWFSENGNVSDGHIRRIIGQVFEFSRIYWKSVQQQSRPVTAIYPEMIAEFGCYFEGRDIPQNDLTQNTPWFI